MVVQRAQLSIAGSHPLRGRTRASLEGAFLENHRSTAAVEPIMGVVPRGKNERAWKEGIGSHQTILLARRTRTMKRCSSDARSEGQSGNSLVQEGVTIQRRQQEALVGRAQMRLAPLPRQKECVVME